ncbi:AraC family transcriptional regulator [Paenalcaligenes suwonensis]|uniref:AraC family transcriptional regulator n=1 Tax=Paenalcaligenes suwonensis TaxID=1202713 RepID=UPI001F61FC52|nr:helix-turn-helix transcriptional regulator [Paenalcaligenes suwonensis]
MSVDPLVHLPSETAARPITGLAVEYPHAHVIAAHAHTRSQFLYATKGVMVVETSDGRWVVPPTRGVWLLADVKHSVRMSGAVSMRTLFIDPDAAPNLPDKDCVLNVSPLLRELMLEASQIPLDYDIDSRDGRLMRLILDELQTLPILPFYLPWPNDKRLKRVCEHVAQQPDSTTTAEQWAEKLAMSTKTFHRHFRHHTGITFGQWRQLARLLLSLESLAKGTPIVQVALEHGYNSQSAYTAMFKRHFGITPSAFYQ